MKKMLILILVALVPLGAGAQRSVKKFYRQFHRSEDVIKFKIPGFLTHLGAGIARDHLSKEEGSADALLALEMTKYIKNIRLLVVEDPAQMQNIDVSSFVKQLKSKDNFEELISVRDNEANVQILIRDKRNRIKNMMILVQEDSEFVMISMKTNLRYKDLENFIREIMKKEKIQVIPPKDPEKKIQQVIPRA